MKIAVIGAGAIGSIVAGYLTKSGEDVLLVGRQDHVKAVNANGLCIKSPGKEEVIPVKADVKIDKEYDLVIFATKTNDMEFAYQDNHKFLEGGIILTTQNGVQGDNIISIHFDRSNMIGSIVMFGATYMRSGEVVFNFPGDWILGKPYTANDSKLNDVAEILGKAFSIKISDNIMGMKWLKLFVNFNNCIPALIGKSMQETFEDMDFCRLSVMLLKEGVSIVRDAGIEMVSLPQFPAERILDMASMPIEQGAGIINKTLTTLSKEPLYGSILQSIMRGRASEIDFINGEVTYVAKSIRLQSPLNRKIVDLIHKIEQEGRFLEPDVVKKEFNLN